MRRLVSRAGTPDQRRTRSVASRHQWRPSSAVVGGNYTAEVRWTSSLEVLIFNFPTAAASVTSECWGDGGTGYIAAEGGGTESLETACVRMISSPPTSSSSFGPYSCHLSLIQSVRTSLVFRSSAEVVVFLCVLLVDTVTLPQTSLTFFLMYPTCSTCDASITRICNRCERGESFDSRRRRVPRTRPASSSLTRKKI
jgi:hypothetical protein